MPTTSAQDVAFYVARRLKAALSDMARHVFLMNEMQVTMSVGPDGLLRGTE